MDQIPPFSPELIAQLIISSIPEMQMHGNISIDQDKAVILVTRYKTLDDEQRRAVFDLIANLAGYIIYRQENFLDAHLYGDIPDIKFRNRKDSRDFALGYLQTGNVIEVRDGRIHIISETELRAFMILSFVHFMALKWFEKRSADPLQTQRFLRLQERGLGFRLIEVDGDKETELHVIQSKGAVRLFFDECWKSDRMKIPFSRFHEVMKLSRHQTFKPSEYLKTLQLQVGDRFHTTHL